MSNDIRIPHISDSEYNVLAMLLNFDSLEIPLTIDFNPNRQAKFVLSAKDPDGIYHATTNSDLAIALCDLFQKVKTIGRGV